MSGSRTRLRGVVLAGLVVVGLGVAGAVETDATRRDASNVAAGQTTVATDGGAAISVAVDCERSRVEITAPENYRYGATVAVADLSATSSGVTGSTVAPLEGNDTLDFGGRGIVFVFVGHLSAAGEPVPADTVATAVGNCTNATVAGIRTSVGENATTGGTATTDSGTA